MVTVLLVNSDSASSQDLGSEFQQAGIDKYAYKPPSQSPPAQWPTLQELINQNTRLVTFIASLSGSNAAAPYLMDEFSFIFENNYDIKSSSAFSCDPDRPPTVKGNMQTALSSNRLPFMNHFLYQTSFLGIETPNVSYVGTTNAPSGGEGNLGDAANKCKAAYHRQPTFILVDFFDQGPAISTVDMLNGVTNPVGRKDPQTEKEQANSHVYKGLLDLVNTAKSGKNPSIGEWVWAGGDWDSAGGGVSL